MSLPDVTPKGPQPALTPFCCCGTPLPPQCPCMPSDTMNLWIVPSIKPFAPPKPMNICLDSLSLCVQTVGIDRGHGEMFLSLLHLPPRPSIHLESLRVHGSGVRNVPAGGSRVEMQIRSVLLCWQSPSWEYMVYSGRRGFCYTLLLNDMS